MANVSDLVTRLRKRVEDNPPDEDVLARVCEDSDVESFITQAVGEFSAHRPHTAKRLITLTDTLTYDWPTEVLGITRLDIQDGRRLAECVVSWDYLEEGYVRNGDYLLDSGYRKIVFTMANAADLAGTVIELYCYVTHTIPADAAAELVTASTLLDEEVDIAMLRAEALYRGQMANKIVILAVIGDGSSANHGLAMNFIQAQVDKLNAEFLEKVSSASHARL